MDYPRAESLCGLLYDTTNNDIALSDIKFFFRNEIQVFARPAVNSQCRIRFILNHIELYDFAVYLHSIIKCFFK